MDAVSLFDLASLQARWLSARQAAVAGNIANVGTPGYQALDVVPFSEVLDASMASMTGSSSFGGGSTEPAKPVRTITEGGDVSYERELARSSDIRSDYELNAAIVRAFHRMTLQAAR
jgi:flagellar basal-body rod protein FlgB